MTQKLPLKVPALLRANKPTPVLIETELVDSDKHTLGPGRTGEADRGSPWPFWNSLRSMYCLRPAVSQQIREDMPGLQDGSCLTSSFLIFRENLSAGSC